MEIVPNCMICVNALELDTKGVSTCKAFLNEIPEEIILGKDPHEEPHDGDHGIQFEQIKL